MGMKQNQALMAEYPVLEFFQYNHLPEDLKRVSIPFNTLAWKLAKTLPHNGEKYKALDKLLECKDAAVRACVATPVEPEE